MLQLEGVGIGLNPIVLLGGRFAVLISRADDGPSVTLQGRTPSHEPGLVDVELLNLDADGAAIPGERAVLPGSYRYERLNIAKEATLTRLVRQLIRLLTQQVAADVSTSVSVDYEDGSNGDAVISLAKLPSVVLTGPTLRQNRFYSANQPRYDVVGTPMGLQAVRRTPPLTVDLSFGVTVASSRTAELFNLMGALATFLNRNHWVELPRDPDDASRGTVRWEMDVDGDFHTQLASREDLRVFACGLVVRGFDVDEGLPFDVAGAVEHPILETGALQ